MKRSLKLSKTVKKPHFGGSLSIGRIGRECTFLASFLMAPRAKLAENMSSCKTRFWAVHEKCLFSRFLTFFVFFCVFWKIFINPLTFISLILMVKLYLSFIALFYIISI